jgi:transposase
MRYELTDYEWAAVRPFLPNKPRGVSFITRSGFFMFMQIFLRLNLWKLLMQASQSNLK